MADTGEVAASRPGGKPLAVPPAEVALGLPASAESRGEAEVLLEPQGKRSPRAEPPALEVGLVAGKPQRDSCIRRAGESGAEAALAGRSVGGQPQGRQWPSAWEGAGTTS